MRQTHTNAVFRTMFDRTIKVQDINFSRVFYRARLIVSFHVPTAIFKKF